jgi:transposase
MVLIAVDPHKSSHTAVAVDEGGRVLAEVRVEARAPAGLLRWAQRWPERRWAVEGAHGLGHGLAHWLVAQGEAVADVPARLVRRVRVLAGAAKNDPLDARAVAEAALHAASLHPVLAQDDTAVLRLLSDRRDDLTEERTRALNRLHRLLRELRPGGAPRQLTADQAAALLRGRRGCTGAERERLRQARALVADVRRLDRALAEDLGRMQAALRAHGSALTAVPGIGVILAAKLVGRSRPIRRFPTAAHYAAYSGAAPLEASSGEVRRHRLNRTGDRQLNRALHIAALTQARICGSPGHAYVQRKRAEGKSSREALRCLKRRLSDVVYRRLVAHEQNRQPHAA